MSDFELNPFHKIDYDFNPQTGLFEKIKTQPDPRELKRSSFPLRFENTEIDIKSTDTGLSITGKKLNGKSTVFTKAFPLSNTHFYATKSKELLNGKEFAYLSVFHPYLSKIDLKLSVYYFDRQLLDEQIQWGDFDKRMINQWAEIFIAELHATELLKKSAPGTHEYQCALKVMDQYFKQYKAQVRNTKLNK